jgi:hypothetical protein
MATGQLTNELLDDFPKTTRIGSPSGPRETDVDIALKQYKDAGATGVLKVLDYNVDTDGNPVEDKIARQRAGGRAVTLKGRGYGIEDGWVIASRNGCVYAKFYGVGQVPAEYAKAEKAVGEAVPV